MRKTTKLSKRLISALCVVLLAGAGFAAWVNYRFPIAIRPFSALYQFAVLAMLDESSYYWKSHGKAIWKQSGPVRVYLGNVPDPELVKQIEDYLGTLEKYSGLEIQLVFSDRRANVVVLHKPLKELGQLAQSFGPDSLRGPQRTCFSIDGEDSVGRSRIIVGVATELPRKEKGACRFEHMARAIGLMGDRYWSMPFFFDSVFGSGQLSVDDKYVIRTLYDNRMAAGSDSKSLYLTAWKVLRELEEKVRELGENALLHPNYVARHSSK